MSQQQSLNTTAICWVISSEWGEDYEDLLSSISRKHWIPSIWKESPYRSSRRYVPISCVRDVLLLEESIEEISQYTKGVKEWRS